MPAIVGDATVTQNEQDAINAIHAALDLGVNCFDSAEMYGNGYSEQLAILGRKTRPSRALLQIHLSTPTPGKTCPAPATTASKPRR